MSTWLQIQHLQSSTEADKATSSAAAKSDSSTRQSTRRASGGAARNKRTPAAKEGSVAGGILGTFGPRFNRFQTVNYTALQQGDPEAYASNSNNHANNYNFSDSGDGSSSEEDIFPTRSTSTSPPRRKLRRKIGRRGGYSMREAFAEGRAMGNRTNATASCEDLLLEILLADETTPADKMDLSITEDEVDLATPIYRLKLPLPHKVNVDRCRAKYDAELRKLYLTLRLLREFDYVNF